MINNRKTKPAEAGLFFGRWLARFALSSLDRQGAYPQTIQ